MKATNTPQAVAIRMSDFGRRTMDDGVRTAPGTKRSPSCVVCCPISVICYPSQRPLQYAGAELDDRDHVEKQHQCREHERDGDRSGTTAALLLFGEHDALLTVFVVHAGIPLLTTDRDQLRPADHQSGAPQTTRRDRGWKTQTAVWRHRSPRRHHPGS